MFGSSMSFTVRGAPSTITFGYSSGIEVMGCWSASEMRTAPKRAATRRTVESLTVQRAMAAPVPSSTKATSTLPSVSTRRRPPRRGRPRTVTTVPRGTRVGENARNGPPVSWRYSGGVALMSTSSSQVSATGASPSRATSTSAPSTIRNGSRATASRPPRASAAPTADQKIATPSRPRDDVRERDARDEAANVELGEVGGSHGRVDGGTVDEADRAEGGGAERRVDREDDATHDAADVVPPCDAR